MEGISGGREKRAKRVIETRMRKAHCEDSEERDRTGEDSTCWGREDSGK